MAFTSQSMLSANSCSFPTHHQKTPKKPPRAKGSSRFFRANASTGSEDADCNVEECAPEKEVSVSSRIFKFRTSYSDNTRYAKQ